MSRRLNCRVSQNLWNELQAEAKRTGNSLSHIVQEKLGAAYDLEHHTIFQVSTSTAVTKGLFKGCTTVADLKDHGDFGLGTFEDLDGEMILFEGQAYQARDGGIVSIAPETALTPFATVTRFSPEHHSALSAIETQLQLEACLDALRPSDNTFVGIRIDGIFDRIELRAACKAAPGEDLVAATSHQSEFAFENIEGTLVGFWAPAYAKTLTIAGYHLHFISKDRSKGGHLIDVTAQNLQAQLHLETDFHVAVPETEQFLAADLNEDPSADLQIAEHGHANDRN
ncbi:MAG: acetolactate decarboxylase [Roseibium sp.]|uniref:acetolactate decarboxylase n=1 Tax=Roseibium sp. TaxID=1936156 RepID=UPI00260F768A|nr:acetolactate decarboxylase [Roseibium sp.]MCV0425150.1 acetolactate decarboxylase [Roseibium sp.]